MEHVIAHAPTFTTLEVRLNAGETISAQPGCMLAMTPGFEVKAGVGSQMKGQSRMRRAARSMLAGESFFTAIYTAKSDAQRIVLAPSDTGEIRCIAVDDSHRYFVASGAFLACTSGVQLSLQYAGLKGWLATRGLFFMRTDGDGNLFVCSYGSVVEQTLADGERFILDNRYIVAFTASMRFELVKLTDSIRHSFLSGEGLVNRFTGPGTLLYQTRARPSRGFLRSLAELAT